MRKTLLVLLMLLSIQLSAKTIINKDSVEYYYSKAIEFNPNYIEAYDIRSFYYYKINDFINGDKDMAT